MLKLHKHHFIIISLTVIILGLAVFGAYYYYQYQHSQQDDGLSAAQVQKYTDAISKIIVVPMDEKPVVAVINNATTLAGQQAFFGQAANDDILFIYSKAGKAYIYRPSSNKVINVGPLEYSQNTNINSNTNVNSNIPQ